jgi:hypothetical protein
MMGSAFPDYAKQWIASGRLVRILGQPFGHQIVPGGVFFWARRSQIRFLMRVRRLLRHRR